MGIFLYLGRFGKGLGYCVVLLGMIVQYVYVKTLNKQIFDNCKMLLVKEF